MNKDKDKIDFSDLDAVADFLENEAPSETSLKQSQSIKEKYLNPAYKEQWQKKNKKRFEDTDYLEKQNKAIHNNEDVQNKRKKTLSKTWTKEKRKQVGKAHAKRWQDPAFAHKTNTNRDIANKTPEVKAIRRKAEAKKWADKEMKTAILRKAGQSKPIESNDGVFLSLSDAGKFYNMSLGQVRERILGIVKVNEHNFRYITWEEYDKKVAY